MIVRWFNLVGALMLFIGLFLNELVFLNIWNGMNFSLVLVAVVYYGVALWLSLWGGSRTQAT